MIESDETPMPAVVADRIDRLVRDAFFGTATTAHASTTTKTYAGEEITVEKMREAMEQIKEILPHPIPLIIESTLMVEDGEPYDMQRTWKERLFTLPWRPLKATRTVVPMVPRKDALRLPDGKLIMHPVVAAKVRASLGANAICDPRAGNFGFPGNRP